MAAKEETHHAMPSTKPRICFKDRYDLERLYCLHLVGIIVEHFMETVVQTTTRWTDERERNLFFPKIRNQKDILS